MLFSKFQPKNYFQNIIITHNEDAKIIIKQVLTNFRTHCKKQLFFTT